MSSKKALTSSNKSSAGETVSVLADARDRARAARSGFNAVFQRPNNGAMETRDISRKEFFVQYRLALRAMERELDAPDIAAAHGERYCRVVEDAPDSIDLLNHLFALCAGDFAGALTAGALDLVAAADFAGAKNKVFADYFIRHFQNACDTGLGVFRDYLTFLKDQATGAMASNAPPRPLPGLMSALAPPPPFNSTVAGDNLENFVDYLNRLAVSADPLLTGQFFRYFDHEFRSARMDNIRPLNAFYGFRETRAAFYRYFQNFAGGAENLPLLITSLPGQGKTHLTLAHAFAFPEIVTVLPEPSDLGKNLENLLRVLSQRRSRRYALFFDDIDPRKIDWYYFRTHVGGSFSPPSNVAIIIASNHEFPANIASRGRGITFPMFDEITCQDMVEDFLRDMGMRKPPTNLVSIIAADYVEAYGQRAFEELSPRTLSRYLAVYKNDMSRRRKTLELSRGEVITRPDSQAFFEANHKVISRLQES